MAVGYLDHPCWVYTASDSTTDFLILTGKHESSNGNKFGFVLALDASDLSTPINVMEL
jgi:hypothetical protein